MTTTIHWRVLGWKLGRAVLCGIMISVVWTGFDVWWAGRLFEPSIMFAYFSAGTMGAWMAREDEKAVTIATRQP